MANTSEVDVGLLSAAREAANAASNAAFAEVYKCLPISNAPVNQRLYHYTDLSGFISIVTGGKIWASNAYFMNDKAELFHGASILDGVISERGYIEENYINKRSRA